jgi:hypothetical protein
MENKCEFSFCLFVTKQFFLHGHRSHNDLSNINWIRGFIHILRVFRYKVISRSKFFSNIFGS